MLCSFVRVGARGFGGWGMRGGTLPCFSQYASLLTMRFTSQVDSRSLALSLPVARVRWRRVPPSSPPPPPAAALPPSAPPTARPTVVCRALRATAALSRWRSSTAAWPWPRRRACLPPTLASASRATSLSLSTSRCETRSSPPVHQSRHGPGPRPAHHPQAQALRTPPPAPPPSCPPLPS